MLVLVLETINWTVLIFSEEYDSSDYAVYPVRTKPTKSSAYDEENNPFLIKQIQMQHIAHVHQRYTCSTMIANILPLPFQGLVLRVPRIEKVLVKIWPQTDNCTSLRESSPRNPQRDNQNQA